jgi:hypothetical protein
VSLVLPVFQEYVSAPLTVSIACVPLHTVAFITLTIGIGFTVTVTVAWFVHPGVVAVTVYVVVVEGVTVIEVPVPPLLHW